MTHYRTHMWWGNNEEGTVGEALHNSDRAHNALSAVNGYLTEETLHLGKLRQIHDLTEEEGDLVHQWATDLLCDMHHLADEMGVEWYAWINRAHNRYQEERDEEEREQHLSKMEADSAALERIYRVIDGERWSSGTIEAVADVVASTGRFIHAPKEEQ